jgi:hypothetical protein
MNLKEVEGNDLDSDEYRKADKKLPQMNTGDLAFEANVEREVKSQCKKNGVCPQKKEDSLHGAPFENLIQEGVQRHIPSQKLSLSIEGIKMTFRKFGISLATFQNLS